MGRGAGFSNCESLRKKWTRQGASEKARTRELASDVRDIPTASGRKILVSGIYPLGRHASIPFRAGALAGNHQVHRLHAYRWALNTGKLNAPEIKAPFHIPESPACQKSRCKKVTQQIYEKRNCACDLQNENNPQVR